MMNPDELGVNNNKERVDNLEVAAVSPVPAQTQKPETNNTASESGASVSQENKPTGQSTQGSSNILDLTKDHGGVLDTTKGSGGVLDLNQTTNNPLLDKLQEQGNAGTTQSGTNAGQSGSGTGTAGSAPSSTGVGPTKEAAGSSFDNPFAAFDKSQENTSGQNSGTGIGDSYFGSNPLKEMENVKAGVDDGKVARLKDDLTKNHDFWVNYGTDGMRYFQIEGYNTYDQSMTEMIITVPENDTSDAAVAYRNKVSEVETALKELEAARKSGDEAQIKASEEKLNNLSKQAQESAVSYAQKNPDAIQNANAYELRKDGWETDEKGNILANEKNFEKFKAESGNDVMDMEGFKNVTEEINAYGDNSGQAMQDRIDANKALEAVSSEKTSTDDTAQGMLGAALRDAATPSYNADGTLSYKFDPNNLNDKQRAILDRVDSWKKQNEKRKAAGQDPISFEDYVHRGGLSQDVVIYKEVKLPKIESMAGKWHQAVDVMSKEEKANRVSFQKRLGDKDKPGYAVKQKSESNERQVESNFK